MAVVVVVIFIAASLIGACSCNPSNIGGNEITMEANHIIAIKPMHFLWLIHRSYPNGFLICIYLSKLIAQRLRIDAVADRTSNDSHILQKSSGNGQY